MADGHFQDVELLRRELAVLILEWAGKSVKDDPDGPMSTALTRAVSEAARNAVAEQQQVLVADAADRIAEALERRGAAGGLLLRLRPWTLAFIAGGAAALLSLAFFLGLQTGRAEAPSPAAPAATSAPIAPLAPTVDEPARSVAAPRAEAPRPADRDQRAAPPAARPASRSPQRELGRPAPAGEDAPARSTQPVGSAVTPPVTPLGPTTP